MASAMLPLRLAASGRPALTGISSGPRGTCRAPTAARRRSIKTASLSVRTPIPTCAFSYRATRPKAILRCGVDFRGDTRALVRAGDAEGDRLFQSLLDL